MKEYVHQYLKNNQEAILRGDSAALVRQDAIPGGSWRRLVASLSGWHKTYIPDLDDTGSRSAPPVILMGLGNIADAANDFNERQWEKAAKAELGVEFPVYEDWWFDTKKFWAEENYRLISKLCGDYINQINIATEKAVTSGLSPAQLAQQIAKIDHTISTGRANLIARDQIGKLNGQVTQARMEAAGLEMYIWSTSGDERVRSSHAKLDEKLCRWDDASVYSDDGGKTWKPRPAGAIKVHPGEDIQCRCCALSYWDELVGEVDQKIAEIEGLDALAAQNIAVMPKATVQEKSLNEPEDENIAVLKAEYEAKRKIFEELDREFDAVNKEYDELEKYINENMFSDNIDDKKNRWYELGDRRQELEEPYYAARIAQERALYAYKGAQVHSLDEFKQLQQSEGEQFAADVARNSVRDIGDWYEGLSMGERESIMLYTEELGNKTIQPILFGQEKSPAIVSAWKKNIDEITAALSRYETRMDMVVYRNTKKAFYGDLQSGEIFTYKGFTSTAIEDNNRFSHDDGDGLKLEIRVPKGTHGIWLDGDTGSATEITRHKGEDEFLINRDTTFKVIKVEGNKMIIEVIGQ
jgi:SPP1 gp7 family putative phage head morphogenesis protein